MKTKLLLTLVCGLALSLSAVRADSLPLNTEVKIKFQCVVDPKPNQNNFKFDTSDLLQIIATDQNISVPAGARLWISTNGQFLVVAPAGNETVLAAVDTNLLNLTVYNDIYTSKTSFEPTRTRINVSGTKVVTVNYTGSTVAFSVSVYGKYNSTSEIVGTNTTTTIKYTATGFGPGGISGKSFIATGDFDVNMP
ncbi:MAG TPA: hypothetical protein VK742_05110 [Candidatus Sulfotelmatobacter sp.]|nr:hypothetical protein [Candidatus Sulfotelmatobacter sp.]